MNRRNYLKLLSEQIHCKRAVPMVLKEIEAHIEDQKSDFIAAGMTNLEAEEAAVQEMGDPVAVGTELDRIHRPKIAWRMVFIVVILSLAGLVLQGAVELSIYYRAGEEGLYELFMGSTFKRQILCMFIGSILMICICRMNYTIIEKCAVPLWCIILAVLAWYCTITPPVNGGYYLAWSIAYILIPVYTGIIWHYRNQNRKGLLKSIVFLIITWAFSIYKLNNFGVAYLILLIGAVILQIAVCWRIFGKEKKKNSLILWGVMIATQVMGVCGYLAVKGYMLEEYQRARLSAILEPGQSPVYQSLITGIEYITGHSETIVSVPADSPDMILLKGDYLWLYLMKYLGNEAGVLLILAEMVFFAGILILTLRQKNKLGRLLGLGCALFFGIRMIAYISMNLGCMCTSATVCMPFLSYGNINLLITYVYVGIVMSVYYNSRLVKNM